MTLRLAAPAPTPAERLALVLRANHADGTDPKGRACERPVVAGDAAASSSRRQQLRHAGLAEQADGSWCDPEWDRHGLAWWYPHLVVMVKVRSTTGRTGAGGSVAVPVDLSALDFLAGRYWSLSEAPTEQSLDDPESYREGFVPTVMALEQSARIALGLGPRHRSRAQGYDGLPGSFDDRVPAAIEWLAVHAEQLVDVAPMLARTIRDEAVRLIGKAALLVLGNRFEATLNQCQHCAQTTVIADEDRAFCRNPDCRTADGARHCWRLTEVVDVMTGETTWRWVDVDEPNVRGRGQISDEQLSRWSATG